METYIKTYDEGMGPAILIVGPGLDDATRTRKLAASLTGRFRVIRLCRRQYRLDLKAAHPAAYSVAEEVADVVAIAREVGRPVILYGHSSGGVVALEALAAEPSLFAGAVIFEPASVIDRPWGGDGVIAMARAAIAARRPGRALAIFSKDATGYPGWQASLVGAIAVLIPRYRRLVPCQIDDLEAMNQLGNRTAAYADITVRTVLLGGDRSPARNTAVLDTLERTMPNARRIVMHNRDHGADVKATKTVAGIIEEFAQANSAI